ncbi:hypothetical protein GYMLUDRAFT_429931 [Collybiopsis luxurians FD-317 M1]|uniref:Uncharacterized protein n=1 Tax=Collybiopsis luxurians FD-317 M1 TaxID=944289 RepID=A0A0D0CWA9_9AGAR|nr:hypothetical protein GYMLUDRAFT_429931 [Collybiopsis luxurians FD-317 M1]
MKVFCRVFLAAASFLSFVKTTPTFDINIAEREEMVVCPGQVTISETFIGVKDHVRVARVDCPGDNTTGSTMDARETPARRTQTRGRTLISSRQDNGAAPVDVCGARCNTDCFTPSGGGPDPNDCAVIADAMKYYSQSANNTFVISPGLNSRLVLSYNTCQTFYVNQSPGQQSYCFDDWAAIVNWVAPNCQSTENAHGGNCVAEDQQWFIQVQTKS